MGLLLHVCLGLLCVLSLIACSRSTSSRSIPEPALHQCQCPVVVPFSTSEQRNDFRQAEGLVNAQAVARGTEVERTVAKRLLFKSLKRAAEGGLAGGLAMAIQVVALMWIRTTINYQYRYGTGSIDSFKILYAEGGIARFYRGILPALIQGPLCRFGDTAANAGTLELLAAFSLTARIPTALKTIMASLVAALFRIVLMPIDTVKTTMQVEGKNGLANLLFRFRHTGPSVFFTGSLASAAATFAGHYPWFFSHNFLSKTLPIAHGKPMKIARSALIGFLSSAVSDLCANSIRVIKVYKQASVDTLSYADVVRKIVHDDGWIGLFGRGLLTKLLANGLQGIMFSVLWKYLDEALFKPQASRDTVSSASEKKEQ